MRRKQSKQTRLRANMASPLLFKDDIGFVIDPIVDEEGDSSFLSKAGNTPAGIDSHSFINQANLGGNAVTDNHPHFFDMQKAVEQVPFG